LLRLCTLLAAVVLFLVVAVFMPSMRGEQAPEAVVEATERPNIIYIVTDDQEAAMVRYMPRVQRYLVKEGVNFDRAFVNLPTCCPSRASVLRGQYAHNHNVKSNLWPQGGFKRFMREGHNRQNLAIWMKKAGYTTGLSGKFMNEYEHRFVPRGWDYWNAHVGRIAEFRMNHNGKINDYSEQVDTLDSVIGRRAVKFIDREAPKKKPFFLYVSTIAPHAPAHHARKHRNMFKNTPLPRPPSFEKDAFSKKKLRDMTVYHRNRLRSVQTVDEMIQHIVMRLKKHGQLNNTYRTYARTI
jgi:arylsulfatase A-like enzyme